MIREIIDCIFGFIHSLAFCITGFAFLVLIGMIGEGASTMFGKDKEGKNE